MFRFITIIHSQYQVNCRFEMSLISHIHSHLNLFYVIGLSPYNPNTHGSSSSFHLAAMSKYLQFLVCECCGIWSLYTLNVYEAINVLTLTETIIVNLYLVCDIIRAAFILMQCLIYRHAMNEMMAIFINLELFFAHHLGHRICYRAFGQRYRRRVWAVLCICSLYIASYSIRAFLNNDISYAASLFKVQQFMTAFCYLHAIFYIDLLSYHLMQLNTVIENDMVTLDKMDGAMNQTRRRAHIQQRLKCYKIVHFRLWMATRRINEFFGYGLMAILLHTFADLVYVAFWMFEQFYSKMALCAILSE